MKYSYLAHKSDCSIFRDLTFYEDKAILMDCDGEILFAFPKSWTDEQIFTALEFANKAHSIGFKRGKLAKIHEIRTALNL